MFKSSKYHVFIIFVLDIANYFLIHIEKHYFFVIINDRYFTFLNVNYLYILK